jgi:hypothetical protein
LFFKVCTDCQELPTDAADAYDDDAQQDRGIEINGRRKKHANRNMMLLTRASIITSPG